MIQFFCLRWFDCLGLVPSSDCLLNLRFFVSSWLHIFTSYAQGVLVWSIVNGALFRTHLNCGLRFLVARPSIKYLFALVCLTPYFYQQLMHSLSDWYFEINTSDDIFQIWVSDWYFKWYFVSHYINHFISFHFPFFSKTFTVDTVDELFF